MPDITYDVGRVSFIMKGAWNLATNYEKLDAVSYNGSLYIAKQDVPGGTAITNTTYWQLAAEKGDKGDTGGVDSVNGQQGDVWFPDSRQLISDGYTTDTAPFLAKGNDSDSDRFELAKKLGNTVAVNQLVNSSSFSNVHGENGVSASWTDTSTLSISGTTSAAAWIYAQATNIIAANNHTYLALTDVVPSNARFGILEYTGGNFIYAPEGEKYVIYTNVNGIKAINFSLPASVTYNFTPKPRLIDLTLWFGSNDRIPSDLLSHPENWGRYYAGSLDYAAGYLDSADGTVLKSIGRNVWDEEWEQGGFDPSTGNPASVTTKIRSANFCECIPNTDYCGYVGVLSWLTLWWYDANKDFISFDSKYTRPCVFESPSNARYFKISTEGNVYGGTYLNDITISLYYPGESGYDQYYPFSVLAEVDTGSEVLRSAGAVADEKTPDGTITRRIGVVDLGTLTWNYSSSAGQEFFYASITGAKSKAWGTLSNAACPPYMQVTYDDVNGQNGMFGINPAGNTFKACNTSYSDAAAFKTAMSGVYLYYELATPTTEQGTAFAPIVATVKNGVLSWTNTKGIPVGHESHYFENLRKRVEDRLPDPPSADGTYRLTCTISGGVKTYSWEA